MFLIGVIPKDGQRKVVEEFFELFKTPWELYRPGCVYDVVIATADEIPEVNTKLLLLYGPAIKRIDVSLGISARGRHKHTILNEGDTALPIYDELLTFADGDKGIPSITANSETAGLKFASTDSVVMRLGYDLFNEVQFLLSVGQPVEYAHIPTLDIHIRMLRNWILNEKIPLLEIPPVPAGYAFVVCLTHDIDFVGIRNHKFDHTMWGFLYRATAGAFRNLLRGRISMGQLLKSWQAVASLPFVYAGWAKDFWEPFEWYLEVEKGLPTTYFLIPFKGCAGERVPGPHANRRAAAYDLDELSHWTATLKTEGCELGVHGVDAWHSVEKGRTELAKIAGITGESIVGIRMHWLLQDANTVSVLEESGYAYDSTVGYNETIGYRAGTSQVFRPFGAKKLLELPLHIQDGALFYPKRLDLSEEDAEEHCRALMDNASEFGGVLTVIWHDRSHGPERFWGNFYIKLLHELKFSNAWFATGTQTVCWFRTRRQVRFERLAQDTGVRTVLDSGEETPSRLSLRIYQPSVGSVDRQSSNGAKPAFIDVPWDGKNAMEFDSFTRRVSAPPLEIPAAEICR